MVNDAPHNVRAAVVARDHRLRRTSCRREGGGRPQGPLLPQAMRVCDIELSHACHSKARQASLVASVKMEAR